MRWQYLPAWVLYTLVTALNIPLMLRHRLTMAHLVLANPSLPWGGMEIDSKVEIMERFRGAPQFLDQVLLPVEAGVESNLAAARSFLSRRGTAYPVIAKPDRGCVGFGVRLIHTEDELREVLALTPVDYLLQEYADLPEEYGLFFFRPPGEDGVRITGLTRKEIPTVTGDGRSTVRALVAMDARFEANRGAVLCHARGLDRVPARGETVSLLVQASHTYGAWFTDATAEVTPELAAWVDEFLSRDPEFHHGRMDVRSKDLAALLAGEPAAVIEINGCMSEPIHVYDDRHTLAYGLAEFYRAYRRAYTAAAAHRGRRPLRLGAMIGAYRRFFRGKRQVTARIG